MLLSIQVQYCPSKGQALTLMNRNCIRQPERKLSTGTRNALKLKGTHVRKDWNHPRGTLRKGWSLIAIHLDQQQRRHGRRRILTYIPRNIINRTHRAVHESYFSPQVTRKHDPRTNTKLQICNSGDRFSASSSV